MTCTFCARWFLVSSCPPGGNRVEGFPKSGVTASPSPVPRERGCVSTVSRRRWVLFLVRSLALLMFESAFIGNSEECSQSGVRLSRLREPTALGSLHTLLAETVNYECNVSPPLEIGLGKVPLALEPLYEASTPCSISTRASLPHCPLAARSLRSRVSCSRYKRVQPDSGVSEVSRIQRSVCSSSVAVARSVVRYNQRPVPRMLGSPLSMSARLLKRLDSL